MSQGSRRRSRREADRALVREVLQCLVERRVVPPEAATSALSAFERLHPSSPEPGEVLVPHAWCACDHEHSVYTATGKPVRECAWVFCRCPGFSPRSLRPPTEEEKVELRRKLERDWTARRKARP